MQALRVLALLEGLSLIALLFIAMPLKYSYGMPEAVKIVGQTHGILFLLFNAALFYHVSRGHLSDSRAFLGLLCSFVPFGTFWFKAKYLKVEDSLTD
ncbi:DUF3817 domain-containing protein [Thiomicrorhabdus sediminis]|uniref:DUF3817 domain-containing protein n=1 Tax=Thiomicrorhabdus sediminis TaxID=2580412 RepID=A0A4V1HHZ7_9GAMM|nr:DUF3817 domain-containing protein [Thiomicrorhabdus sediminis]QCU90763.1 DUF3817 domain-containing protein [Thiomicrorhabdus sediminis]